MRIVFFYIVVALVLIMVLEALAYDPSSFEKDVVDQRGHTDTISKSNLTEITVIETSGYTQEDGVSVENFQMDQDQIFEINVVFIWSDDIGSNDEFRLILLRDGDELRNVVESSGQISMNLANDNGRLSGNYTLQIHAVDCPGAVGILPIDRDNGNSWDLEISARILPEDV